MRYFCYDEPGEDGENVVVTMSEDEIRKEYFPYWYEKMCKKFGKQKVDETYSFEECLIDWQVIHGAWKV
jgi:hypothetical protein